MNKDEDRNFDGSSSLDTDRIHPFDEGGHTGEDGGLLAVVASPTRHEAGNTMDVVFVVDHAVERTTGVTLKSQPQWIRLDSRTW